MEFDFTETNLRQSYYTTLDVFSQLGGLSASVGGILAQLSILFVMNYNYLLSSVIKRKSQHTLKLQEIKQYLKLIPEITKIIREKLG